MVLSCFLRLIPLLAILMAANPLIQAGTLPPPRGGVSSGLSLWYRADMGVQTEVGGIDVSAWGDQSGNDRHAYTLFNDEGTSEYPALVFQFGVLGNSSSISFSTISVLGFDGTFLANSNYTIFVLEGRNRAGLDNYFMGTTNACSLAEPCDPDGVLGLGYTDSATPGKDFLVQNHSLPGLICGYR